MHCIIMQCIIHYKVNILKQADQENFIGHIGQIMLIWQRIYRDILTKENLTPTDKRILYGLSRHGQCTKTQLADAIFLEHASLSRSIIRLKNKGLINQITLKEDRRHTLISLTSKGRKLSIRLKKKFLKTIQSSIKSSVNKSGQKLSVTNEYLAVFHEQLTIHINQQEL